MKRADGSDRPRAAAPGSTLPRRTVEYNGIATQSRRWQGFRHRAGDIFICTPAKNGTTWTQAICAMLIFGTTEVSPGAISPWIDANFWPVEEVNAMLEAQAHRRFIKTHTPLDGIPWWRECTYLAVYRDPRDAFFSMLSHMVNMEERFRQKLAADAPQFAAPPPWLERAIAGDLRASFALFAESPAEPGRSEQFTLAAIAHHYDSFRRFAALPNIHLFHYSNLKRDPAGSIEVIARAIGVAVTKDSAREVAEATSFERMRVNAGRFLPNPGIGAWKNDTDFFARGRQGEWRGTLGAGDLECYRNAIAKLLPPDAAAWLEDGNGAA